MPTMPARSVPDIWLLRPHGISLGHRTRLDSQVQSRARVSFHQIRSSVLVRGKPPASRAATLRLEVVMTKKELKALNAELIDLLVAFKEQIDDKLDELAAAEEDGSNGVTVMGSECTLAHRFEQNR